MTNPHAPDALAARLRERAAIVGLNHAVLEMREALAAAEAKVGWRECMPSLLRKHRHSPASGEPLMRSNFTP